MFTCFAENNGRRSANFHTSYFRRRIIFYQIFNLNKHFFGNSAGSITRKKKKQVDVDRTDVGLIFENSVAIDIRNVRYEYIRSIVFMRSTKTPKITNILTLI